MSTCQLKNSRIQFSHHKRGFNLVQRSLMSDLPFAPACERNKQPILQKLQIIFKQYLKPEQNPKILEIGSGTGQHAVHFAAAHPLIEWQTSDVMYNLEQIQKQLYYHSKLENIKQPIELDVENDEHWKNAKIEGGYDLIYTANTMHIMSWEQVQKMVRFVPQVLRQDGGLFVVYGPFKKGDLTTPGNAQFDVSLKFQSNGVQGVRELEDVKKEGENYNLVLIENYDMPSNNNLLVFRVN
eukprot:TRINITY_DN4693_c0_g2_i1.p2 TRINITY_DN4693_c0_g2~~TRINITY_DN4693_c0_g2_i1.p2  ORF type:complete len:239 (+),score=24.93 TRINITY_DN4693_c0_g2_i1:50-766(+)